MEFNIKGVLDIKDCFLFLTTSEDIVGDRERSNNCLMISMKMD